MRWKIELDEELKLPLTEDIRKQLEAIQKKEQKNLRLERDLKWKITNVHSKSFVVWSAFHPGLCDGYGVHILGIRRVIAPGRALRLSYIMLMLYPA